MDEVTFSYTKATSLSPKTKALYPVGQQHKSQYIGATGNPVDYIIHLASAAKSNEFVDFPVETLCISYQQEYGLPVKIARLAGIFGAGVLCDDTRIFGQFARCTAEGNDISLQAAGNV